MAEKAWQSYIKKVNELVGRILETQGAKIEQTAEVLADAVAKDGLIHVFGTGHSHIVADEVFWRASTLASVHAILEASMTGTTEVTKSNPMEKLEGSGEIIVDYHRIAPPDAVIVISNSGNNAAPIEVAMAARGRGVKVIAITSTEYSDYLNPLHSSGKQLKDAADIVVDNCSPIGDAVLAFDGLKQRVGPSSTILGIYIINALMVETVNILLGRGIKPDVYYNGSLAANSKEVKEHNNRLISKYFSRIRNL